MGLSIGSWTEIRETLGLFALLVFAFFAWLGTGIAHGALAVMIVLLATDYRRAWEIFSQDPTGRIFALFLSYLLIGAAWAAHRWPETSHAQWASVWPWLSLWLFLPVAWWLKNHWSRIWMVMVLAPLGLLVGILKRSAWADLPQWLEGERYEFGYTALGVSLLSVVVIIGLLTFLPRLSSLAKSSFTRSAIVLGTVTLLLFFLLVLLVAQSRGAWLGLVFASLLLALLAAFSQRGKLSRPTTQATAGLLVTLITAVVLGSVALSRFGSTFAERIHSEADVIPKLLTLDEAQLPYSPWGARVHLSLWGLRLIAKHPWVGWGPGANAPRHLLKLEFGDRQSPFLSVTAHFVHLHNAYIETLMRFGVLGTSLLGLGLCLFFRAVLAQRRSGTLPFDCFVFAVAVLFTMLFFGLYEFRLLHTDYRFLSMLFGGIFYTAALHQQTGQRPPMVAPSALEASE